MKVINTLCAAVLAGTCLAGPLAIHAQAQGIIPDIQVAQGDEANVPKLARPSEADLRGHLTGVVEFRHVTDVRALQWGGSLYPYTRTSRFLILETAQGEWQFGPEVANSAELQETLVGALNRWREANQP